MSRYIIPRVRSQVNFHIKRERGWDNRFIYSKMKDYCSLNDKNYIKPKLFQETLRNPYGDYKPNNDNNYNSKLRTKNNFYYLSKNPNHHVNQYNNSNASNSFHYNNESFQNLEQCDKVLTLWNHLGVTESYKELFNVVVTQLEDIEKNDFYEIELNSLTSLFDNLNLLEQYLTTRESSISNLKNYNNKLSSILKESSPETNENHLNLISNEISNLRITTVNLVNQFNKIRNDYSYSINNGKFDMNLLSKKFGFDKNYLIKMKDEMSFLKHGYIKFFFNINDTIDPFILSASAETGNCLLRQVPIDKELSDHIKVSQYLILQDLIYYQSGNFKNQVIRTISPIRRRTGTGKMLNQSGNGFYSKNRKSIQINAKEMKRSHEKEGRGSVSKEKEDNEEDEVKHKKDKVTKNNKENDNEKDKKKKKEIVSEDINNKNVNNNVDKKNNKNNEEVEYEKVDKQSKEKKKKTKTKKEDEIYEESEEQMQNVDNELKGKEKENKKKSK